MLKIGERDLVLLLIGSGAEGESPTDIGGITRLQKFLFLLEREYNVRPEGDGFGFEPYKAGPYSSKLYDHIEFLENVGWLRSDKAAPATEPEEAELSRLTFDQLMGSDDESDGVAADAFEERRFALTEEGANKVGELLKRGELRPFVDAVRELKKRYGKYSLNDLLYYVYTKYPEMTTESEIKDHVLRRRRAN